MDRELVNKLVAEVVRRLAPKLGADGSRETILSVCTGCCGDVERAAEQMKNMVMTGFKLDLFFSETATDTYREIVLQLLDGLPQITMVDHPDWYRALNRADAVIVPVASMNTASKLSMLIADSVPSQLLLNAMTMVKPLFIARDGALSRQITSSNGSSVTGMTTPLMVALGERLAVIESYGAVLCDIAALSTTLELQLGEIQGVPQNMVSAGHIVSTVPGGGERTSQVMGSSRSIKHVKGRIIAASYVNLAAQGGYDLSYEPGGIITPMAKDLASQNGIRLIVRETTS